MIIPTRLCTQYVNARPRIELQSYLRCLFINTLFIDIVSRVYEKLPGGGPLILDDFEAARRLCVLP